MVDKQGDPVDSTTASTIPPDHYLFEFGGKATIRELKDRPKWGKMTEMQVAQARFQMKKADDEARDAAIAASGGGFPSARPA